MPGGATAADVSSSLTASNPFSLTTTKEETMKIGTKVSFTRRNGEVATGRVHGDAWNKGKGDWLPVNIGDKKNEKLVQVRPSALSRVR